ncbi:hypothetical protein [Moraxella lacunata]|uniref:hypothetical protein n=1 Tax=Moraxella lacunata TaxID=477 RepID=UPI003EE379D5
MFVNMNDYYFFIYKLIKIGYFISVFNMRFTQVIYERTYPNRSPKRAFTHHPRCRGQPCHEHATLCQS